MRGSNTIEEIRGIGYEQNVEENFENVLEEKLKEFPDADRYKKQVEDTKMLTSLYKKYQRGEYFTFEELNFIYEIYDNIEEFGWQKDPRIEEIIKSRYIETDLQQIFAHMDCKNQEEALILSFPHLRYIHHLEFPEDLDCSLYMDNVETIGYLKLPKKMRSLSMDKARKVKQIVFPEEVKYFSMDALEDLSNITLPKKMNGDLNIGRIKSTRGKKVIIDGCKKIHIHALSWTQYYGLQNNIAENFSISVGHFICDPHIKPNYKKQQNKSRVKQKKK